MASDLEIFEGQSDDLGSESVSDDQDDFEQYLKILFNIAKDNLNDYGDDKDRNFAGDEELEELTDAKLEHKFIDLFSSKVKDFSVFCVTKTSDESAKVKLGWLWKRENVTFKTSADRERHCTSKKYTGVTDLKKIIEVPSYGELVVSFEQDDSEFPTKLRNFVTYWFLQDHTILFRNTDYIWMENVDVD